MNYIYKDTDGVFKQLEIEHTTDGTYHNLKREGYGIQGQFGREDFAQIHIDFYNGKISRKEMRRQLDMC